MRAADVVRLSGWAPMIFLAATAVGSGLLTAILLAPLSYLAVLVTAPLVASAMTILAGLLLAWRNATVEARQDALDRQTDEMVVALRAVAQRAEVSPAAAKSAPDYTRVA